MRCNSGTTCSRGALTPRPFPGGKGANWAHNAHRRLDAVAVGSGEEEVFLIVQVRDGANLLAARVEDADLRADVPLEIERDGGDIPPFAEHRADLLAREVPLGVE